MDLPRPIDVQVLKFDGSLHRRWPAQLVLHQQSLLVLDARFQEDVNHKLLGKISRGTVSTEYYWLDRWYNVFRFSDESSGLRNFYCNVNFPPTFNGEVLSYIDLDIDLLVAPDYSYQVLDLDEFDHNANKFCYSPEIRENAQSAVDQLISLIQMRAFPFNGD